MRGGGTERKEKEGRLTDVQLLKGCRLAKAGTGPEKYLGSWHNDVCCCQCYLIVRDTFHQSVFIFAIQLQLCA